jgi:biopolymer transport protein ExbD
MNLPKDPEIPPQINILPLIDVVFSLLTFFILSSLFLSSPEGVPVNLPAQSDFEPADTDNEPSHHHD